MPSTHAYSVPRHLEGHLACQCNPLSAFQHIPPWAARPIGSAGSGPVQAPTTHLDDIATQCNVLLQDSGDLQPH